MKAFNPMPTSPSSWMEGWWQFSTWHTHVPTRSTKISSAFSPHWPTAHRFPIANMELFEQTKDLAVMEERNRLARDLHDSAKQKAFAALAQLGTAHGILNGQAGNLSRCT